MAENLLSHFPLDIGEEVRIAPVSGLQFFINYINILEGVKTKIKNLHWSAKKLPNADKRGAHLYLDDYLETVSEFQDKVAEGSMGILGIIPLDCVSGTPFNALNTADLISYVKTETYKFYTNIPMGPAYAGLKSEVEVFIQETNNFDYRFQLTE